MVLHGASTVIPAFVEECNRYGGKLDGAQGVPEDMLLKAGKYGVCKINIDTDLRLAMTASIRKYLAEHPEDFDPRSYLGAGRQAIKDMSPTKCGTSLIPPIVFNQKTAALSSSCFFGLIGAPVHPYGEGIGKISVSGTRIDKKHINRIGIGTRSTP